MGVVGKSPAGALGLLLLFATAAAASQHPSGEYAQFKQCPLERATIVDCIYSVNDKGSFSIGERTVPIVNPVTLQGGFEGEGKAIQFYGARNGITLSKATQPVPRGLLGAAAPAWWPRFFREWYADSIDDGQTEVNAALELTGPSKGLTDISLSTENLLSRKGTALGLPVRIQLSNPTLGDNCYIGSDGNPVQIDFTTGRDGALAGSSGNQTFNPPFTITTISGGKFVNSSFTAPAASGCGGIFSFFIDPLVNATLGTSSGGQSNSAVLEGKFQDALAEAVTRSKRS